ncbi:protein fem-1 homolog C-like [Dysidea avara]|uniref:protein fem-1 homolog C-like n=1 Tax=Dysidea avara TaxID=196820 RepID=UPI00332C6400
MADVTDFRRPYDPLKPVMTAIQDGNMDNLKAALECPKAKEAFTTTIHADSVRKKSPLITAVVNNHEQVIKFMLEEYKDVCNIEQVCTITIDKKSIEAAPPLWTAATMGHFEVVKVLVKHGADINHTTKSNSTPIRGAAYDGHTAIVEYLANEGADIHKANNCGQSPLSIAAAMERCECVKFLLKKGANVHQKGHNEDTPLHVCVESGSDQVSRLLVDAGALNTPNILGHTPAMLAACHGHHWLLEFFDKQFQLSNMERYNCYCLLGAREMLTSTSTAMEWWLRAISIRSAKPAEVPITFKPPAVYRNLVEPSSTEQLNQLDDDADHLLLAALMYERIMGPNHPSLAFTLRVCGDMFIEKGDYGRCLEIWEHSLVTDKASRLAYELQIKEDVLFTTRGFFTMMSNSYIPAIKPMVEWSLNELCNAKNNKLSEMELVAAIVYLLGAWIKAIQMTKGAAKREKEQDVFDQAVIQLLELGRDLKDPTALLIMCLKNFEDKDSNSNINREIYRLDLPVEQVIHSLIANGAVLTDTDDDRNFPLHYAVQMKTVRAKNIVKVLIEDGAPLYACNYDGKTAMDLCSDDKKCPNVTREVMEQYYHTHFTLQELCARTIVMGRVEYQHNMPKSLQEFISWH